MTAEELIAEGRRLQRPCVLLRASGRGPVAGVWHGKDYSDDYCRWLTINAEAIPGWEGGETFLSVIGEIGHEAGYIEEVPELEQFPGIMLHAEAASVLPPFDAVYLLGSPAVQRWLRSLGRAPEDDHLGSFPNVPAVDAYERLWQSEYPLYDNGGDVYAMLGGWHFSWPDGDWRELVNERLLVTTFKDPEPWVEGWLMRSGQMRVVQRIT